MKVFISQPMKGLTDDEIKANRKKAIDLITLKYDGDVEFIDSFIEEDAPKINNIATYYLGKSIEMMADAEVVAFLPGYEKARGCMIEYNVARSYGYTIIMISEDYKSTSGIRHSDATDNTINRIVL